MGVNISDLDCTDNYLGYENNNRVISPAVGYKNPLQYPKKDSGCGTDRTDTTPNANFDCRFMRDKNLIGSDPDSPYSNKATCVFIEIKPTIK